MKINNWEIAKWYNQILQKNTQDFHCFKENKIEINLHVYEETS
jgi:hypothetical protein